MKSIKTHLPTIILLLCLYVGLSLLLYPTVADWWNSFHQSRVVADYIQAVDDLDEKDYQKVLEDARAYNTRLLGKADYWTMTEEDEAEYTSLLNVAGTGVMGYVSIPQIGVSLPIYHGTDAGVLQEAIGHLSHTSLPVGGESTHVVISGHRGLPSAKLFTKLDELLEGERFQLHILNETLTYEVDQILTVLPREVDALDITKGEDYCTLLTCTPYGINSHRLLVRGHRVSDEDVIMKVPRDAQKVKAGIVAAVLFLPLMIPLLAVLFWRYRRYRRHIGKEKQHG